MMKNSQDMPHPLSPVHMSHRRQALPTGAAGSVCPAASNAAQVVWPARTALL
jgi:hypothetical protein